MLASSALKIVVLPRLLDSPCVPEDAPPPHAVIKLKHVAIETMRISGRNSFNFFVEVFVSVNQFECGINSSVSQRIPQILLDIL